MYKRQGQARELLAAGRVRVADAIVDKPATIVHPDEDVACLLYTSDAADERSSVDLGGRRIIKKNMYN